ncbi:GNAT family N-acetyltransferase [Halorussus amylolyticus]|uniref:GNAT family N-acetyltransferase n=1 Tax=Halorussus amylolyticus TaxID=1126242 RepID=UPI001052612E|nr:GNAT family N-acetyltransferase [Halorussus amylolyticus]
MEFLRLPAEEAAVGRYVEALRVPYQRELQAIIDGFALADDTDVVSAEMDFQMERLGTESYRIVVAFDPADDGKSERDIAVADGNFVGFIATDIDEAPDVFDRPDRLLVCDFYVRGSYRGEGLAGELMERAVERAREEGCSELALDVDVDNERALSFYKKVGFETTRNRMTVETSSLSR